MRAERLRRAIGAWMVFGGIGCGGIGCGAATEQNASMSQTESATESVVAPSPGAATAEITAPTVSAPAASASSAEASPSEESLASDPAALAIADPASEFDPLTASPSLSTSVVGPNDGSIRGAVPLPERGPGFRSNARRPNATAFYGTVELVRALVRAAAVVDAELPGGELVINDLGLPEGGPIPRHASHQTGRDVDVLFYYLDADGEPWPSKGVPLDLRGRGWDFGDLADPSDDVPVRLDVRRTWRFVQALVEQDLEPDGPAVQRIFVAEHLRTLLLAEAERARAPRAARERFEELTCQPGSPHDDHLHIRLFCSAEDLLEGCADGPPMYPWRRADLRRAGVEPRPAPPPRRSRRARTVSAREARAAAGELHPRVQAFLAEREAWIVPRHPGRPYCR